MVTLYFTSDTHFADPRVLRIDRRPFDSLQAHDEALIDAWNETVGPQDDIWHLGDVARGTTEQVERLLARLNGRKHLIVGNNDGPATLAATGFTSVQHYTELTADGRMFVLCHYPFRTWNQMGQGAVDLHGHSHGRLTPVTRQRDVGVDAWNYRPVTVEQLLARRRRNS